MSQTLCDGISAAQSRRSSTLALHDDLWQFKVLCDALRIFWARERWSPLPENAQSACAGIDFDTHTINPCFYEIVRKICVLWDQPGEQAAQRQQRQRRARVVHHARPRLQSVNVATSARWHWHREPRGGGLLRPPVDS